MKRLWILAVAVLLMMTAAGCAGNTASTEKAEATGPATEAPYIDAQLDEPEWTLAEGNLQLEDASNIYAESEDILYFAIVTDSSGKQELRFRMNDETATMLQGQSPDINYFITLDSEKIGNATLNEDCTVAVITAENANGEITALASKIRGLSE